jgi:succinyldiaminopimelate transaminase
VTATVGFTPPPYPYDRLNELRAIADRHKGGCVDLSVGTPTDPPPAVVVEALAHSGAERSYPPSIGTVAFREAAAGWVGTRFGVNLDPNNVAACIGTKEFVAGAPHWLRLRHPERDVVLHPAISYPSYALGAELACAKPVVVPVDASFRLDLDAIDEADAARALCLWVNTPGNPAGALDDLAAVAAWGRAHDVPVLSDECYAEFTWDGAPHSILEYGLDGFLAVHSLSKRSNLAGARVGFYAGDPDLIQYLSEVRKHAGFMVPGPVQAAAVAAWADSAHVDEQRARYARRLERCQGLLADIGVDVPLPAGAFYLWAPAPEGDAWALAAALAERAGMLVSPGEFYGVAGASYVRLAMVQPDERLDLVAARLAASR